MGEPREADPGAAPGGQEPSGQAVLHQDVLGDVEHAVGNLLQRMHHAARAVAQPQGEQLQAALHDLERFLALLFDYVSPTAVQLRRTEVRVVIDSLSAQLRGCGARVSLGAAATGTVLVDPRLLNRTFQLLGEVCVPDARLAGDWHIEATRSLADGRLECVLHKAPPGVTVEPPPVAPPQATSARSVLAAAVAVRLLELQGGELRRLTSSEHSYTVILPSGER